MAVGGLPALAVASYFNRTKLFNKKTQQEDPRLLLDRFTIVNGYGWRANGALVGIILRLAILGFIAIGWYSMLDPKVPGIPLPWPNWGFYTIHTFALSTLYFTICLILTMKRYCYGSKEEGQQFTRFQEWGLKKLHLLYQYLLSANILVTVGFWTVTRLTIKPADRPGYITGWECIIHHAMNSIFMAIEFYINDSTVEPINWDIAALGSVLYFTASVLIFGILPSIALDLRDTRSCSVVTLLLISVVGYYLLWCLADHIRKILRNVALEKDLLVGV